MNYDLHCHSTASDGLFAPRELVDAARRGGVERQGDGLGRGDLEAAGQTFSVGDNRLAEAGAIALILEGRQAGGVDRVAEEFHALLQGFIGW